MKRTNKDIQLSPSDLMKFQGCQHQSCLDLKAAQGSLQRPQKDSAQQTLSQKLGIEHEKAFLESLKTPSIRIVEIGNEGGSLSKKAQETLMALKDGADWIYQAAFEAPVWFGYADFLRRVDRPSALGDFSYEVIDTKLKRSPDPKHVIQLCLYSSLLCDIQGVMPESMHVVLGDSQYCSLRVVEFLSYVQRQRRHLERFVIEPWGTRPDPVKACMLCDWQDRCADEWDRKEDLCLVAGITTGQRRKLEAAGIDTIAALATSKKPVPRISKQTLDRLRQQSAMQLDRRRGGSPAFSLRSSEVGKGLARLPEPDAGDVFFDMEGDPFYPGGLEYLFGLYFRDSPKDTFKAIWAHDREAEKAALRELLQVLTVHFHKHPKAHLYHYNHYEPSALKRLCSFHATGEEKLDKMLREQRFVDLYRVVQQGIFVSEPSYSLKNLEAFYMDKRSGDVATAGDSIDAYESYRETGDATLLESIRSYNETDCRSTAGLRDWLVDTVRPKTLAWYNTKKAATAPTEDEKGAYELEREELWAALKPDRSKIGEDACQLLLDLCSFHRREDKPVWWSVFDCAEKETDELIDHLDCLAGLSATEPAKADKRSMVRTYRFPVQETKIRTDSQVRAKIEETPPVTVKAMDLASGTVTLRFGPKAGSPPESLDLIPDGPLNNKVLRAAVKRVTLDIAAGNHRYRAIEDILLRHLPRLNGHQSGTSILPDGQELISQMSKAIRSMDSTYLPVQGPPGTGKTYSSSHVVADLLAEGFKVGVTSNSHKAINNLVRAVTERAKERQVAFDMVKKSGSDEEDDLGGMVTIVTTNEEVAVGKWQLVAGTPWLFAREEFDGKFDYLFVDEAGQVSLANILAVGAAASNLVLVGDPMQLSQPIQGVHPGQSGTSGLEYILNGHATVPPTMGILLPITHRMHPNICRFISDLVYDGRLESEPKTRGQKILFSSEKSTLPEAGIAFIEIDHEGNSQTSEEEAGKIEEILSTLLMSSYVDSKGKTHRMTLDDVLVVAPYNAQVNLLKKTLPTGARVGTIDKFQGQEAQVCIVSMTTSSGEELPRDIEFLFSRNRLNVAISRAKSLAIVVSSPRLLDVECKTIEQMRLVNTLCALKDYSEGPRT